MTSMITARVDTEKRSRAEKVFNIDVRLAAVHNESPLPHPSPLKLGLAEGKYGFADDFDAAFDAMDDEIAEMFS